MRAPLFASFTTVATFSLLFAACGGKQGDAKTPESAATEPGPGTSNASTPAPQGSSTTTTTTTLGDSGDLQGAKLGSSTTTVVENRPDAGPAGGPGANKGGEMGRSRDDIRAIIVARRDEARACYDEGLKRNPQMEGDLDIKWTIDPAGNVTEVSADDARSTIHDKGVADCIGAIVRRIRFAKSDKGKESRVHYPFNFHPKQNQIGKGGGGAPQK
jgi:hypothetical protein